MSEPSSNGINLNQKPLVQHLLLQQPPQFNNEEEEEIDLKGITQIVRRRGWWILAVGSVVSGLVGLYLFKQPPVYKESFQLLIPPPNADSLSNPILGEIASMSGVGGDNAYYGTQLQILVSNILLTPVVEQLRQQKQFFEILLRKIDDLTLMISNNSQNFQSQVAGSGIFDIKDLRNKCKRKFQKIKSEFDDNALAKQNQGSREGRG